MAEMDIFKEILFNANRIGIPVNYGAHARLLEGCLLLKPSALK
jgi:hypothetical protein